MEYNTQNIAEIAIRYNLLNDSLQELKDIREDSAGAILAYVSDLYGNAEESLGFLKKLPADLQKELEIGNLERKLNDFANVHIRL